MHGDKTMGKDYKNKAKGKARRGIISWKDIPENVEKQLDRENFDIGEYRKEKVEKRDKAYRKDMKRQLQEYEDKEKRD